MTRPSAARGWLAAGLLLVGLLAPAAAAPAKPAAQKPEAELYQAELEARGLVDKTRATPKLLKREVELADEELFSGNPGLAAARLWAVVEGPRWSDLSETEDFQDAEYRLGLALAKGGGAATARRYFARVLGRGREAPSYEAALRGYIDVCIEARVMKTCIAELDRLGAEDQHEEIAYLRGRAAFEGLTGDDAEAELSKVTPKSRFYSAALYLRGVMRVKKGDLKNANDPFCAVADVKDGDSLRFYIDGRYYALRDLARLALGRVAHEEGRFDDAFYHYFLIPQDSPRLEEALFEAAWSSLQRKDFDLGARLANELLKSFPDSPRVAEARLLLATLEVKSCRFDAADQRFADFLKDAEPLARAIEQALSDGERRRDLAQRILSREERRQVEIARRTTQVPDKAVADAPPPEPPQSLDDKLAALLTVDPRFFRLSALAKGLRAEAADAERVADAWRELLKKVSGTAVQGGGVDAAALADKAAALGQRLARLAQRAAAELKLVSQALDDIARRKGDLAAALTRRLQAEANEDASPAGAKGLGPLLRADLAHAEKLRTQAAGLAARFDAASGDLIRDALNDLKAKMDDLVRRARLGRIDAVVGAKRKLEREIEDLAAGRFPAELFGRLHIEGLIADDEEYWPPEKEIWLDEYENYK